MIDLKRTLNNGTGRGEKASERKEIKNGAGESSTRGGRVQGRIQTSEEKKAAQ